MDEPLGSTMVRKACGDRDPGRSADGGGGMMVDELGAAVQPVVPIVVEQPVVDELGAATGAAVTVLDTVEPTVAPTVAQLAAVANRIRSIH